MNWAAYEISMTRTCFTLATNSSSAFTGKGKIISGMNAATFSPRDSAMRTASLTAPLDEPQQTMPRSAVAGPYRRARWYLSRIGFSLR